MTLVAKIITCISIFIAWSSSFAQDTLTFKGIEVEHYSHCDSGNIICKREDDGGFHLILIKPKDTIINCTRSSFLHGVILSIKEDESGRNASANFLWKDFDESHRDGFSYDGHGRVMVSEIKKGHYSIELIEWDHNKNELIPLASGTMRTKTISLDEDMYMSHEIDFDKRNYNIRK